MIVEVLVIARSSEKARSVPESAMPYSSTPAGPTVPFETSAIEVPPDRRLPSSMIVVVYPRTALVEVAKVEVPVEIALTLGSGLRVIELPPEMENTKIGSKVNI